MGICGSSMSEAERIAEIESHKIDKINERDFNNDQAKIKLLLLGAGESGKSTVFKQMKVFIIIFIILPSCCMELDILKKIVKQRCQ